MILSLIAIFSSKVVLDMETIRKDLLDRHNLYRSKQKAPTLTRLASLETIAQAYSEKLVSLGYLVHSRIT